MCKMDCKSEYSPCRKKEGKESATKTQRIASIAVQVKNQSTDKITTTKNKTWLVGQWILACRKELLFALVRLLMFFATFVLCKKLLQTKKPCLVL